MKRLFSIVLIALIVPIVSLQSQGVNLLQECGDMSHAVLRSLLVTPSTGQFRERGRIADEPRRNDLERKYYRVEKYTVINDNIVAFEMDKPEPLVEESVELVADIPEFEEVKEVVEEDSEFLYDDADLGFVPEIGEISDEDLEEEKKRQAENPNVDIGGFNL